jgi:uncharacterized damage-inducible protein DinB
MRSEEIRLMIPFETWGPDGDLKPSSYPDLSALSAHWREDQAIMRSWLAGLSDDDVTGPWEADGPGGLPLWQHLMHLDTHAIQQFSDAAVLLTRAGQSPGELDISNSSKAAAAPPVLSRLS